MSDQSAYWEKKSVSRRTALRAAAAGSAEAIALSLVGCGDDEGGGAATTATQATQEEDWTKGKPGGKLNTNSPNYPISLDMVGASGGQTRIGGLVFSGLLGFKAGKSGVDLSLDVETDAAQALPEQPSETTYIFKLRPGIRFHNGRELTSQDVKYSFDRYAFGEKSIHAEAYAWLDRVETPDPQTIIFRSKAPNADAIYTMSAYQSAYLMLKSHEESPDVTQKLLGSGPYTWFAGENPVSVTLKKNADYFNKPYPYFDEITFFFITDDARRVADFVSRQIQFTWHNTTQLGAQIKQGRPDAQMFLTPASGNAVMLRVDQAPFTDKRVRQALSMGSDRKQIREAVSDGEGEDNTTLSVASSYWGTSKPSQLKSARYWTFDPAGARQLLAAAGFNGPIEGRLTHTNAPAAQATIDTATLAIAKWREVGVANFTPQTLNAAALNDNVLRGRFDGAAIHLTGIQPILGTLIKRLFWSPPGGVTPPTNNNSYINDPELNRLIDKQLTQFKLDERRATFREIDELMGEQQYRPGFSTNNNRWFADPSVKNASVYNWAAIGTGGYLKYWWFG